jgi:hypothetical protein
VELHARNGATLVAAGISLPQSNLRHKGPAKTNRRNRRQASLVAAKPAYLTLKKVTGTTSFARILPARPRP